MSEETGRNKKIVDYVLARQKGLESSTERQNWEETVRDIAEYFVPRRSMFDTEDKGRRQGKNLYDGSPANAAKIMSDGFMGNLASPRIKWFKLRLPLRPPQNADAMPFVELEDVPEIAKWLQDTERVLYSAFNRSNYYEALSEYFLDGVTFGTAVMSADYDWDNMTPRFSTRHPREVFIDENYRGQIDTVIRKFKMPIRRAVARFGVESFSAADLQAAENNAGRDVNVIHAVFPRGDRDITRIDGLNKPFASVYINQDDRRILLEDGFDRMPYVVWRFRKNSEEVYGRSPAWDHLQDAIVLNKMKKSMLLAVQRAVDPAWMIPDIMRNGFQSTPGYRNFYDTASGRDSKAYPLVPGTNYPFGKAEVDDIRRIINDGFHVDFFLMLSNLEKEMTATEILERQGEKAILLSAGMGRLNAEALQPTIDLVFDMEFKVGNIPPPPDILFEYQGEKIEIDFIGPLAQALEQYLGSQPIRNSLNALASYATLFPQMLDLINADEAGREILESYGMPQDAVNGEEEVAQMRMMRAQMAQAQQAAAQMQASAASYEKLTKPAEPGSPAEAMMGEEGASEEGGLFL